MKNVIVFLFVILSVSLITSCDNKGKVAEKISKQEIEVKKMNFDQLKENPKSAEALIASYVDYVKKYPKDSLSPKYLLEAGKLVGSMGNTVEAIKFYQRVFTEYPEHKEAPTCLMAVAFLYETTYQDMANAKKFYQMFIDKYPNHEMAASARLSIENLGKSPEEMLKEAILRNQNSK